MGTLIPEMFVPILVENTNNEKHKNHLKGTRQNYQLICIYISTLKIQMNHDMLNC